MFRKIIASIILSSVILSVCGCSGNTAQTSTTTAAVTTEATTTAPVTTAATTTTIDPEEALKAEKAEKMQEQYEEQREKYQKRYEKLTENMEIPMISIITLDNEEVLSKEEYVTSIVEVLNCDEEFELSEAAGVRVRGNSTAEGNEKPYRIKFDKKQNMLGLHDGKEYKNWVLLKSNWNLVMDYMGFTLADVILEDRYYSSDCTFVNVYINGKFKGIYLLCEQNQIADDRVDVYEPKESETQTEIGYLVEIDHYAKDGDEYYFNVDYLGAELTDISGKTNTFVDADYTIKNDTYSDEQRDFIARYINGAFKILYEAAENNNPMMFDEDYNVVSAEGVYETAEEAAAAAIDLESLAFLLIRDELIHDYDVGEGSFYMAVDFSESSTMERLTFTAPWDFNWAYNDSPNRNFFACTFQPEIGESDRSNPWYIVAMKAEWFSEIVKTKWAELYETDALKNAVKDVRAAAEELRTDLGDEEWKIDSANQVCDFVERRIRWLQKQWGEEAEENKE
ncbi:MAG: CotH kinase family protein [Ruminiclostridium sp.]|nr:CotH kinase family protein [Ruminiclostridium sp.]